MAWVPGSYSGGLMGFVDSLSSQKWFPMLLPFAVMLGGGILVDLLPISGAFWILFYLGAALLAGWTLTRRQGFWFVVIVSVVVMLGTAIVASDQSHVIGGPMPILETLFTGDTPDGAVLRSGAVEPAASNPASRCSKSESEN